MSPDSRTLKIEAARVALGHVEDGMKLGIGTGSTAEEFVRLLGERTAAGLAVVGVATSERTAALCSDLNIPLATLDDEPRLDLVIDGADEIGPDLALIKGGGGALLREKIVAAAGQRMIVIADASKTVETLGAFPLPIEVVRFGREASRRAIVATCKKMGLSGAIALRETDKEPFVTDEGHHILDASFGRITDPEAVSAALNAIPGVVEHGLFLGLADLAIIASEGGVQVVEANR